MKIIAKASIYDDDWASYRLLDADTEEQVGRAICCLWEGVSLHVGTQAATEFRLNLSDTLQRLGHELVEVREPKWVQTSPPEWARQ